MIICSWCNKKAKFGWSEDKKNDPKRFIMCDKCYNLGNDFDVCCGQSNQKGYDEAVKKWKKVTV